MLYGVGENLWGEGFWDDQYRILGGQHIWLC